MDHQAIIKSLQKSSLFHSLSDAQLQRIAQKSKLRQFFPEDIIVWQGQPSNSLFLITNGIVAVKNIRQEKENLLAYLMPGQTFGEVGILENQPRSATVVAISEVDVLVLQREDFVDILHRYSEVAIELSRLLGKYLIEANQRLSQENKRIQVILIFNLHEDNGGASIANIMAQELADKEQRPTVYVEYRHSEELLKTLVNAGGVNTFHHPSGYDIVMPQVDNYLPSTTQVTLMLDKLRSSYENIVIGLGDKLDESCLALLEHANQVLLLASPSKGVDLKIERISKQIEATIRAGETSVFTMVNRSKREYQDVMLEVTPDFDIPYLEEFPEFKLSRRTKLKVPDHVAEILNTCIARLERTHSIGIFIPTTVDVDSTIDTSIYVQEALNFLAERFGGATSRDSSGVWNSKIAGLVGEKVYLVESYVTQKDINTYLDEVVGFLKRLKLELRQEAMALEVDRKLTLI